MLRQQFLTSLKVDCPITESITKGGSPKSHEQVKCHFGLVVMLIRQKMIDLGWAICAVAPNANMVHDILKKACGGVGDGGECLGLSEMTTAQASQYFENCRDWAANELQLVIPEPNKDWRRKIVATA